MFPPKHFDNFSPLRADAINININRRFRLDAFIFFFKAGLRLQDMIRSLEFCLRVACFWECCSGSQNIYIPYTSIFRISQGTLHCSKRGPS